MSNDLTSQAALLFPSRLKARVFKSARHCGNCKNFDIPRGQALLVQISPNFANVLPHISPDKFMKKYEAVPVLDENGVQKKDENGNPVWESVEVQPEGDSGARWTDYGACAKYKDIRWAKWTDKNPCEGWR